MKTDGWMDHNLYFFGEAYRLQSSLYDVVASVKVPTVQTQVQDFGEFNSQHTFCKIKGESLMLRREARYICKE